MKKTLPKHLLIDFAIILGNTFLSYALLFLSELSAVLLWNKMKHLTLVLMCALQIAINIQLYKTLLKKFYEPAEHKNPVLYLLLPILTAAAEAGVFALLMAVGYEINFGLDYLRMLINYLPLVLFTLLPPLVAYRLCFKKCVGEAYCVYMLSAFGVAMLPTSLVYLMCNIG